MFGLGCCFYDICCVVGAVGAESWMMLLIIEFLNVEIYLCNDFHVFSFLGLGLCSFLYMSW